VVGLTLAPAAAAKGALAAAGATAIVSIGAAAAGARRTRRGDPVEYPGRLGEGAKGLRDEQEKQDTGEAASKRLHNPAGAMAPAEESLALPQQWANGPKVPSDRY
jgi:hypothetical protein